MSKKIIFCADGTWDAPQSSTNVYTLFKAIQTTSDQVPYYDDGVGSDGTPLQQLAGGAIGEGIFQKIIDGYTKIAHVYDPGDEIFIFGFSRGAYTARCLAGMIAICGLPKEAVDANLPNDAFQAYRNPALRGAFNAKYALFNAQITMVGVWDTVGALGIPAIDGGVDPIKYGFLDLNLHADVQNAFHALAVDEKRREFPATLWNPPTPPRDGQVLEQVWFTGVHCDIGGGYPETGLSDITLAWMMGKAKALGRQFSDDVWAEYAQVDAANALGQLHESWSALWLFPRWRNVAPTSALGNSVAIRSNYDVTYLPANLTLPNRAPAPTYSLVPVVKPPDA